MKRRSPRVSELICAGVSCLMFLVGLPRADGASFIINNVDGPGEGFNDPTPTSPVVNVALVVE